MLDVAVGSLEELAYFETYSLEVERHLVLGLGRNVDYSRKIDKHIRRRDSKSPFLDFENAENKHSSFAFDAEEEHRSPCR